MTIRILLILVLFAILGGCVNNKNYKVHKDTITEYYREINMKYITINNYSMIRQLINNILRWMITMMIISMLSCTIAYCIDVIINIIGYLIKEPIIVILGSIGLGYIMTGMIYGLIN